MSSPVPSFNVAPLAGEFQTMTGGGDATKGLTFDFCSAVIEGVVADPNFTGINDEDIRRILGLESYALNNQLAAQNALIADALYDLTNALAAYGTRSAESPVESFIQDAKTKVNALNPGKYTFPA